MGGTAEGPLTAEVSAEQDGACLLSSAAFHVGRQRHKAAKGRGHVAQLLARLPGEQNPLSSVPGTTPHEVL